MASKDRKTINTGIRLTPSQYERLATLAQHMGVKRNHVLGVLIDKAKIKGKQSVEVTVTGKSNRHDAHVSEAQSITAVRS